MEAPSKETNVLSVSVKISELHPSAVPRPGQFIGASARTYSAQAICTPSHPHSAVNRPGSLRVWLASGPGR